MLGGVYLNTGTIPSKSMREGRYSIKYKIKKKKKNKKNISAILNISGFRQRLFHGKSHMGKENLQFQDLTQRVNKVIKTQRQTMLEYYDKNDIDVIYGHGSFTDPHTLKVEKDDGKVVKLRGKNFLIACGTRPARKDEIPCDGTFIYDSDQILRSNRIPSNLIVVGAGSSKHHIFYLTYFLFYLSFEFYFFLFII